MAGQVEEMYELPLSSRNEIQNFQIETTKTGYTRNAQVLLLFYVRSSCLKDYSHVELTKNLSVLQSATGKN